MDLRRTTLKELVAKMFLPSYKVIKWIKEYNIGIKLGSQYRFNESDFYKLKEIERGEVKK